MDLKEKIYFRFGFVKYWLRMIWQHQKEQKRNELLDKVSVFTAIYASILVFLGLTTTKHGTYPSKMIFVATSEVSAAEDFSIWTELWLCKWIPCFFENSN